MTEKTAKERGLTLAGERFKESEAWVYLIWGLTKEGQCDLLAVASSEETRERYEIFGRRHVRPNYHLVKSELVMLDHAFGRGMLPQAMRR